MSLSLNYPVISPSLLLDFANTKALDPRITFTRASTATYYDGKTVAKSEENMLLYSENFELANWVRTGVTITANANTAPDGTSTADLMVPNATDFSKFILQDTQIANGGVYTQSVFVKAGGYNFAQLTPSTRFPLVDYVNFNLSTGAIGNSSGTLNPTITSVGNGWYRISITATANSTGAGRFLIAAINADTNSRAPAFIGDGTSGILIWGAQLEQRSSVTAYTATTTQPITNYIPALQTATANTARFDHNPTTGESLGLEIEEQRTNLSTYSDDFANAAWTKSGTTITADTIVSPDGTLTGDKLVENTVNTSHSVNRTITVVTATSYTFSCYAKLGERNRFRIRFGTSGGAGTFLGSVDFDLVSGTIIGSSSVTSSSITPVGNGWYRCVATDTSSGTSLGCAIFLIDSETNTTYTGDGYSGIYIWGAQLEAGAFPTSYIATVASTVTRSPDAASMTSTNFSSWYRADEGSTYIESIKNGNRDFAQLANFNNGTTSNQIAIGFGSASNPLRQDVNDGGVSQASITAIANTTALGTVLKVAAAYKTNDFAASGNGGAASTDISGTVPTITQVGIGYRSAGTALTFTGTLKKIAYYPARLTDTQLQALTT
jgi:hypothetical protein